jgi:hypothetical protein
MSLGDRMSSAAERVFSTVPKTDYLGFYKNENRWESFKRIADFLSFSNEDVSRIGEVSKNSVRYDEKMPEVVKERLLEIANVCELVASYFDGNLDKTAMWFKAQNPMFGEMSPRDMIRAGRYQKVIKIIQQALQGIEP